MRGVAKDLCWMDEEAKGKALVSVAEIIYSHAVEIDSDNCDIRQLIGLQEHKKRLADLRNTLRQEAARDIRISLRRDIRRELNAKTRMDKGEQLNRLLAGYFDRGKQTLEMQLPDGPSSDRHAWAAAADEHGREVYRDDNNNVDVQMQRLVRLQHLAQREIEAGWQPPAVKFHDILNALASAKMGKQPGSDGVVEMVRALSWSTLLWLYLLILVRLGGWETERPDWREVVLTAIPQKSDKVGFSFNEIHQSAACDTKNSTSVLCSPLSDVKEKPHETNILGYEPGRSTAGVSHCNIETGAVPLCINQVASVRHTPHTTHQTRHQRNVTRRQTERERERRQRKRREKRRREEGGRRKREKKKEKKKKAFSGAPEWHVPVGVTLSARTFHDVCFSKPLTFHDGFMFFASRRCFKHFSRLQAAPLLQIKQGLKSREVLETATRSKKKT